MGHQRPKVLFVDDTERMHALLRAALEGRVEIVSALTEQEARAKIPNLGQFAAIAVDACLKSPKPDTQKLVRDIAQVFKGPIVGVSMMLDFQRELREAGCTHSCDKLTLGAHLQRLFAA